MTAHTLEQREFIALRLARFETPSAIIDAFQNRFPDTHCTNDDIASCDPRQGGVLAPETMARFNAERERILTDPASVPAADRRVRLFILNQELEKHRARGATGLVQSILAQIAIEMRGTEDPAPTAEEGARDGKVEWLVVDPAPEAA